MICQEAPTLFIQRKTHRQHACPPSFTASSLPWPTTKSPSSSSTKVDCNTITQYDFTIGNRSNSNSWYNYQTTLAIRKLRLRFVTALDQPRTTKQTFTQTYNIPIPLAIPLINKWFHSFNNSLTGLSISTYKPQQPQNKHKRPPPSVAQHPRYYQHAKLTYIPPNDIDPGCA